MTLDELKASIREESEEYKDIITRIKAAADNDESYLDVYEHECPDTVYYRLTEDGYQCYYNRVINLYRFYGWAGEPSYP